MSSNKPTFEQSISISLLWCNAWESGELSDEVLADRVSELISTKEGARGFFVIALSSDCPLLDRLPDSLIFQLRAGGESIVDLTVRNLAMSSAMALLHQRNKDTKMQTGSERIRDRCIEILRLLQPDLVKLKLENLMNATRGKGKTYVNFLNRQEYDLEQIKAITKSICAVA